MVRSKVCRVLFVNLLILSILLPNLVGCKNSSMNSDNAEPSIFLEKISFDHVNNSDPFLMFVEYPIYDRTITKPEPDLPQVVNEYLEKTIKYKQQLEEKNLPASTKIVTVFLLESQGVERILVIGDQHYDPENTHINPGTLYLFDTSLTLLLERDSGLSCPFTEYFVSAKFPDRIWIQTNTAGGSNSYGSLHFIRLQKDKLRIQEKYIGDAEYTGFKTFKIINPDTDPRMVLHKNNQFYWEYFFLVYYIFGSIYDFFIEYWPMLVMVIGVLLLSISFTFLWFEKREKPNRKSGKRL